MGHAVYSLSDPRARVFKGFVEELSVAKNREKEFKLMSDVERIAAELIAKERKIYKGVSANVDFTAVLYTVCWDFRRNFLHRYLQWQEFQDGVRTELKN